MNSRLFMDRAFIAILFAALMCLTACSGGEEAEQPQPAAEAEQPEADPAAQPAAEEADPATPEPEPTPPPVEEVTPPAAAEEEEPPAEDPAPALEETPDVIAVADTKEGLTRIGATKCKMCHKIQYNSWAESAHAELEPALDCESCHGSGSEYKKKSVMKDPELARAAGLVTPEPSFCQRCHTDGWQDDMLDQAHAHKEDAG